MKFKLFSLVASVALVSNLALADENSGLLLGIDAGWFHTKVKSNLEHTKNNKKFNGDLEGDVPVFGLRVGYRFSENHRLYGAYNYSSEFSDVINTAKFKIDGEFTTHKFLLGYDFTPKIFEKTRAVLGVYGGYARTNMTLKTSILSLSQDFDGYTYGAKIGALYELNQANEIEFGFKAEQTHYDTRNFSTANSSNFYDPKQTNYGLYLGYTYKF
ncbi:outer membrane beta-barrel protein [Campylobacter lari]|uniref:outer membrane beta-barrel protein n=1 Tax=Campylobacter lari TaxID=201 RepID=UPI000E1417E7|nr:outer membrane beta-barrel protein [Campylobacter lari]EGK8048423.1 porin family protein [Campylobacter lari]MBT0759510.1 outer membrane beta-barrel protein [Campylobacter lari]MCR6526150.1 porin family protein [Campylobacter lari]MCR6547464.1 porin family protein [Campylobacter lari]MCR6559184.1 porin family protein [Campylobacter lari]